MAYNGARVWANGDSPGATDVNRWELGGAYIPLRAFDGANDDAKLTAFMAYAGAQSHKGIVCLLDENKQYSFTSKRNVYDGFTIASAFPTNGDQPRSSQPNAFSVNLSGFSGGWLSANGGTVFGVVVSGLTFNASSSIYLVESSGTPWLWRLNDIGFQNGSGIFGSSAAVVGVDAVQFTGVWNVNNVVDCAFNIGGSDGALCPTNMVLDSPTTVMPATKYLARFTGLTWYNVSHWYVTAEQHSGLLVSGSNKGGLFMNQCTWQGRNANAACYGALIRTSAGLDITQSHLDYAMTSPSSGPNAADGGYVHVASGGVLNISNCWSKLATGQATTTPIVYVESGGYAQVRGLVGLDSNGNRYTPTVRQAVAGLIDADTSVNVVTG